MTPKWLSVSGSICYGLTVYTKKNIPAYHVICKTSVENLNRGEGFIVTPDGNLFHHSPIVREVNCVIEIINDEFVEVIAKRLIQDGEELLVNYDLTPHKRSDFHDYSN